MAKEKSKKLGMAEERKDELVKMELPDKTIMLVYPEDVKQRKTMNWKEVKDKTK